MCKHFLCPLGDLVECLMLNALTQFSKVASAAQVWLELRRAMRRMTWGSRRARSSTQT